MKEKKKSYKGIIAAVLIVMLMSISVGYAALATNLNITGTTAVKKNNWDVHISAVTDVTKTGETTVTSNPTVTGSNTTALTYTVGLVKPGDSYSFKFTVVNAGSIDAKLSALPTLSGLSAANDVFVNHTILNSDNTAITLANSTIPAGTSKTFIVKVEYDTNITASDLPTSDVNLTLGIAMNYIQK